MEYSLEVANLSKHFNCFDLNKVSFKLPKGSIMGLIGENGAGKSTTIKLILNMLHKNGGSVKILGMDGEKEDLAIKQQIGVVMEDTFFHEYMNVSDVSKVMRKLYKNWDDAAYKKRIQQFGLPEKKNLKEFSKGMKMKLSIAAAIAHQPTLLILDEATSGLDPIARNEILDILLDFIQDEEHSVLISSHIISDLEKVADYITFIHKGRVFFSETKDNLLYDYAVIKCGKDEYRRMEPEDVLGCRKSSFGTEVLVKDRKRMQTKYGSLLFDSASIEDIMLFCVRGDGE